MQSAPDRPDESATLAALRRLQVLDTGPEAQFDALVEAASLLCGVPISLISLVDSDRQWFKANVGLPGVTETPRELAFCAHAVLGDELFEVPDASADPRFADNPMVVGQPDIRFYAGVPLRLQSGHRVGTLCVIDRAPRTLTPVQREVLKHLGAAAAVALEGRHAMQALASSEAKFRALSEGAPLGVYHTDASGACTYVNDRWQSIYGLTQAQSLGTGWIAALHPDDRDQVSQTWQERAADKADFDMEFRVLRQDGSLRNVHSRARPLLAGDQTLAGYVGSVEDVTERHELLAQQQESQRRVRRLYEATPAMLLSADMAGRVLAVSDSWLSRLGYQRDEVIGRQTSEFLAPQSRDLMTRVLRPAFLAHGRADQVASQALTRGGEVVDILLSAIVEHDGAGQSVRTLVVIEDVTLRRRAERALEQERLRLLNIIDGTRAGTWEWNVQTGEARFNERWAQIIGCTLDELGPLSIQTWLHHAHPDDLARSQALLEAHFAGHSDAYECEARMRHRDGRWVWVLDRGCVMSRTADGQPEWMYGTHQDITARKQQEENLRKSEASLNRTGHIAGVGGWEVDLVGGALYWSAQTRHIHGVAPDYQPTLQSAIDFYAPEHRPVIAQAVQRATEGGEGWDLELQLIRADGGRIWARAVGSAEFEDGKPVRLVGAFQDITESRCMAAELAEQHELLRVTLQSIGDAVITTDAKSRVQWLNPVAERMTGWTREQALGRPLLQVFHIVNEETRAPSPDPVAACLAEGHVVGLANRTLLVSRNGEEFGIEDSAAPIRSADGELLGVVMVFHDVTEQRRMSGEISYRAAHDALTGLVNRGEFETRLFRALAKAREDHSQHALLYVDLDQFKLVNDACGHTAGDQLLQQMGKLLTDAVRTRDTVARLGGDEFAMILDHCSIEQAQRVAQKVCDRMDDFRFVHDGRRFRIGTSIGLVPVDARWSNTAAILQAADTSCYAAKEAGRNRVHTWFDTDMAMRARQGEMQWTSRIESALDEGRFVLFAQRIFGLGQPDTGLHAEVLLRMRDTDGSLIAPGVFLPAAERFQLATRIDRWVLKTAIDWMLARPALPVISMLCINLSGQSVGDRAFHRWASEVLSEAGADIRARLCLEITETAAVTNMADAALFIEHVREAGVRVALDDFGAGASSFGYLKTLRVDILKIDGQFIRDLVSDPLDEAAVRCFVEVAKVVGVQTVAEFVDQPEVLQRLGPIGVDYAQGFLLHKPEPIDALLVLEESGTTARL